MITPLGEEGAGRCLSSNVITTLGEEGAGLHEGKRELGAELTVYQCDYHTRIKGNWSLC